MKYFIFVFLLLGVFSLGSFVYADTMDFYPSAGEGRISASNAVWATVWGASTGGTRNNAQEEIYAILDGGTYYIQRFFIPFDTSGLPDDISITGATLKIYGAGGLVGSGSVELGLVNTTQDDPTSLTGTDYNNMGSTLGANNITYSDLDSSGEEATFTFNSTGRGWINKTGYTLLGIRQVDNDIDNSAPSGSNYVDFYTSTQAGTEYDPILTVTYTAEEEPEATSTQAYFFPFMQAQVVNTSTTNYFLSTSTMDYLNSQNQFYILFFSVIMFLLALISLVLILS